MKHPLVVLAATAALLLAAGCDRRESSTTTPDRARHATGQGGSHDQAIPGPDETFYTMKEGDSLTSVAKAHGTTVDQLIHRNHLTGDAKAGTRLVVPEKAPAKAPTKP